MFTSSLDSIQDVMFREYAEIFDELSLQYKDVMRVIAGKTVQGKHLIVLAMNECRLALQLRF